jgi:hypothetical protein
MRIAARLFVPEYDFPNNFQRFIHMNVITPDWVKDAVFHQIFPNRFATSERISKKRFTPGTVGF